MFWSVFASFACVLMCYAQCDEPYSAYRSPLGSNGLNLRTTSCLNWRRWWMTLEPQHPSKEVLQIPTWSPFHLKIWRRESWRLWKDTMGRCRAELVHFCVTVTAAGWLDGLRGHNEYVWIPITNMDRCPLAHPICYTDTGSLHNYYGVLNRLQL